MDRSTRIARSAKQVRLKDDDYVAAERSLKWLIAENAAMARSQDPKSNEKLQALVVKHPIDTESAVACLGFLTGLLPTAAIFLKIAFEGNLASLELGFFILGAFSIAATSAAGYFSGKMAGKILANLEKKSWPIMLFALPWVGIVWGLLSGAIGGVVLFGIGAIFAGAIGAVVAPVVLTAFGIFHRLLKTGDVIETARFLPVAFGITLTVASLILGL